VELGKATWESLNEEGRGMDFKIQGTEVGVFLGGRGKEDY